MKQFASLGIEPTTLGSTNLPTEQHETLPNIPDVKYEESQPPHYPCLCCDYVTGLTLNAHVFGFYALDTDK